MNDDRAETLIVDEAFVHLLFWELHAVFLPVHDEKRRVTGVARGPTRNHRKRPARSLDPLGHLVGLPDFRLH